MWEGYAIRKSYVSGAYKGQSYILLKGGHVKPDTNHNNFIFHDECYESVKAAKMVATKYHKTDVRNYTYYGGSEGEATARYQVVKVIGGKLA